MIVMVAVPNNIVERHTTVEWQKLFCNVSITLWQSSSSNAEVAMSSHSFMLLIGL